MYRGAGIQVEQYEQELKDIKEAYGLDPDKVYDKEDLEALKAGQDPA